MIRLTDEEAAQLREWARRGKTEQRTVERARIILLANEGRTNEQIAVELKTRTARVSKWRQRFGKDRLQGLGDAPRSGKPARYDADTEKRLLALLDQALPRGYSHWNGPRLAAALAGVAKRRSGEFSGAMTSVWNAAEAGVSVQIPNSDPKPRMWWGSI